MNTYRCIVSTDEMMQIAICFLLLFEMVVSQVNLSSNGTSSQSSTYYLQNRPQNSLFATTGEATHFFGQGTCATTAEGKTVAWWMLVFASETVFISNVIIYYRDKSQARLAGFSLYITNSSILPNSTSPPLDGLCYHDNGNELPNILQNITCDQMGKHVIIYNERKESVKYPDAYSDVALLELCNVQIIGCYKSLWGGECSKPCAPNCIDRHCYPDNGTCVWGCNSTNCLHGDCNNDGTCAKGCIKGRGGLFCDEYNVASGSAAITSLHPDQNEFHVIDGDKTGTSCVLLTDADSWLQVDAGGLYPIRAINIVLKKQPTIASYSVFVTNTSGDRSEALNIMEDNSVIYTFPFPANKHMIDPMIIGRYVIVLKTTSNTSLNLCELEIIGCPIHLYGDLCSKACPENCDGACHLDSGKCVFGCQNGYTGNTCEQSCPLPRFGKQCSETCHCINQTCDHVSGTCPPGGCWKGWKGHSCSEECETGTFGFNCNQTCEGCLKTECNSTTGLCNNLSGCRPGWKNESGMCDTACKEGYFGDCFSQCYCRDGYCDKSTGECPGNQCDRGWMGDTCSEECELGSFGYNCEERCIGCSNKTCDVYDGNCTYGCEVGYTGFQCRILVEGDMPQSDVSPSPAGAIGGGIGGTLVVVVIAIGVVVYIRRRSTASNKNQEQPRKIKKARSNQPGKQNVAFSEDRDQYVNVDSVNDNRLQTFHIENRDKPASSKDSVYVNREEGDIYCNMTTTKYSVEDLERIIQVKREHNSFETDFENLPKGLHQPHEEGSKDANKNKNRFLTTWPYDHSRVILHGHDTTDYINASYIENYEKKRAYIATQGPKTNTVSEFWHMVWQENVEVIVTVTQLEENGRKKCYHYWPTSITEPLNAGQYTVNIESERENVLYVYRTITMHRKDQKTRRTVHHFHYLQWEDHGVPDTIKLINFYRAVKRTKTLLGGPMIVHCSAGIGRTGTFLAIDALYEHGMKTGFIDVLEYVQMMRKDRMNMIQTQDQYATVYEALLEAFTVPDSSVHKDEFCAHFDRDNSVKTPKNQQKMSIEYKKLQDLKPCYTQDDYRAATLDDNISKNVNKQILPHDRYRPYLMSYGKSRNDYINAVIVPSLIKGKNIIVTQCPLKSTIVDFWTLVYDTDCSTIVCLESETNYFIPSEDRSTSFEQIQVSRERSISPVIDVRIEHKDSKQSKHVQVRLIEDWPSTDLLPCSVDCMLDILDSASNTKDSGSLAVVCRDGCTRSGMFTALYLTLEKLQLENVVDLFYVVRTMQIRRPEFFSHQEEYEFCYKCIRQYFEKESLYANI